MLRIREIRNAKQAAAYYAKSDGGYALDAPDLRREAGGIGAERLGLTGQITADQLTNLLNGLHPDTGERLTARLVKDRICGWDFTASIPKGVTVALERGDVRIQDALWEAARETMADVEAFTHTRERRGGRHENRQTGNLMWFGFEHAESRPVKDDGLPDPDRHLHLVVPNLTYDPEQDKWKAVRMRPVMELRRYFDRRFDMRLAGKLTDLGYRIDTKYRNGRYHTWDIAGLPKSVVTKFSRRTAEIETLRDKLGISDPRSADKLGATSRQFKRADLTLADYRRYWDAKVTPDEARQVAEVIGAAMRGENPAPERTAADAARFAVDHVFERRSVSKWADLQVAAMEHGMGLGRPEQVEPELRRLGVLVKDGQATTRGVLVEEQRVIEFARAGRGTCRAMGARTGSQVEAGAPLELGRDEAEVRRDGPPNSTSIMAGLPGDTATPVPALSSDQAGYSRAGTIGPKTPQDRVHVPEREHLSPDQQRMVDHVTASRDRVILIIGDAGTGKTTAVKSVFERLNKPVAIMAPGAEASRGVLRRDGFSQADTVTAFLNSPERQSAVQGGVIWVDEAGQLPIRDLARLTEVARERNARLVLQGDPKQHRSVGRDGDMLRTLERYAGLAVARLTDIRRQKNDYKAAVEALRDGKPVAGLDRLDALGWVKRTDSHDLLVRDYLAAIDDKKEVLAVAPTHAEADAVTAAIRAGLKAKGAVQGEERTFDTLVPLHLTDAEKGDLSRFDGTETLQWHRNGGTQRAGDRLRVADLKGRPGPASTFAVYRPAQIALAVGDKVRVTGNGWDRTKKHRMDNGSGYTVSGFNKDGSLRLTNGWVVDPGFAHLTHGYVTTSHASQGRTVDRVLIRAGKESLPAVSAEQLYVSVSRGREKATIYTDLPFDELRQAVRRQDERPSATSVFQPRPRRTYDLVRRAKQAWRQLTERATRAIQERTRERNYAYGR